MKSDKELLEELVEYFEDVMAGLLPYPLRLIPISILLTGIFTGFAYLTYLWFKIWKAWSR